jgi:hypothetical protein
VQSVLDVEPGWVSSVLVFVVPEVLDWQGLVDGFAPGWTDFGKFDHHLIGEVSGRLSTWFCEYFRRDCFG